MCEPLHSPLRSISSDDVGICKQVTTSVDPSLYRRLLCFIGHITAVALEIVVSQPSRSFEAQGLLTETLMTALDVGHILLNLVPGKVAESRRKQESQSYAEFLKEASEGINAFTPI